MPDTVQGFLATISIDGNDITASVENFDLDESKTPLRKNTMDGSPAAETIPGAIQGTLAFDGLIDQANLALLQTSWAKEVVVPFSIAVTEADVSTNSLWSGNVVLDAFNRSTSGDDLWRFTMSATISGLPAYTPFAP